MLEAVRISVMLVFVTAAGGLTFLRLYVRQWLHRGLNSSSPSYWIGDILCALSWIFATEYAVLDIWYRHVRDRDAEIHAVNQQKMATFYTTMLQMIFAQMFAINIAIYSIKGSFLCFYFSTAKALKRNVLRLLITVAVFTAISFLVQTLYLCFMCTPISSFWALSETSCIYTKWDGINGVNTSFHMATDLTTMIMGFTIVNQSLTLTRRGWYCIFFIFALGSLTILLNCVRIALSFELVNRVRRGALIGSNTSKALDEWMTLCTLAEMSIGIIAVCLPAFRVWWRVHISGDALSHLPNALRSNAFATGSGFSKYVSSSRSKNATKVSVESERRLQEQPSRSKSSVEMVGVKVGGSLMDRADC